MRHIEIVKTGRISIDVFIDGEKQKHVIDIKLFFDEKDGCMKFRIETAADNGETYAQVFSDFTLTYRSAERIAVPTFDDPHLTMPAPKDDDGPYAHDCEYAHMARTCGCGFCRALNREAAPVSDTTFYLMGLLQQRDAKGREKYGTTLDRKDLSLTEWLQHQTEELLDGAGYAQAAKREAERLLRIETAARNATVLLQGCEFAWEARDALKQLEGALRS